MGKSRKLIHIFVAIAVVSTVAVVTSQTVAPPSAGAAPEHKVAIDLHAAGNNTCAATDTNEVYCWGHTIDALGDGVTGGGNDWDPATGQSRPLKTLQPGVEVSGPCSRNQAGGVHCWGGTATYDLAGANAFSTPPWGSKVPRTYGFGTAKEIAGRCALLVSGSVQCFGFDNVGQVGSGRNGVTPGAFPRAPSAHSAVNVLGLSNAVTLTTTSNGYCASTSNGQVWCWGTNYAGELGDGQSGWAQYPCISGGGLCDMQRHSNVPVQVPGITDAESVHGTCAIRTNGNVSCWGENAGGRFNTGVSSSLIYTPTEMTHLAGATDIAVNNRSVCAAFADGRLRCRGTGPLGNGVDHATPADVLVHTHADAKAVQVVGGSYYHTCVRYADGRLACWGSNRVGQLGNGTFAAPNQLILTPQFVIGFGAEEEEDQFSITVELDPASVESEDIVAGQPSEVDVTITLMNGDDQDVTNVTLQEWGMSRTYSGQPMLFGYGDPGAVGPNEIALTGTVDNITGMPLPDVPAEGELVLKGKLLVDSPGTFEVNAHVSAKGRAPTTLTRIGKAMLNIASGLVVDLTGTKAATPDLAEITAELTNNTGETIEMDWGTGLTTEVLRGNVPVGNLSNPSTPLPTTMEPDAVATVTWTAPIIEVGTVVATLSGTGTTTSNLPVVVFSELSIGITAGDVTAAEVQRAANDGVESVLQTAIDVTEPAEAAFVEKVKTETQQFRTTRYESYKNAGYSDTMASVYASWDTNTEAAERYLIGLADAQERRALELGDQTAATVGSVMALARDPQQRTALANAIVDGLKTNTQYFGDSFAIPVDEKVQNIWWGLKTAGTNTASALNQAYVGQGEIWQTNRELWNNDRFAYAGQASNRHGGMVIDFGATVVTELGSAATGGAGTVAMGTARKVIGQGVSKFRTTAALGKGVAAGDDAVGSVARTLDAAEDRVRRYQDLEYGTDLSMDELESLGGFNRADAAAMGKLIDDVKDQYGVDIQLVARTAEPESVLVEGGLGKRSYTKEKAVGPIDRLIGGPDVLSGRVTLFEPKPLSAKKLAALENMEPGFTARYEARFQTQLKYWNEFKSGQSKTARLVTASERHRGITVLSEVPGRPTHGVEYLEQLFEPEFQTRRGYTPERAAELYQELKDYPEQTKTWMELEQVDGAFTLVDRIDGVARPIISDYDLQAVFPLDGNFPMGKRGPIEAFVKKRMDELGRSGRHGWSESAFDLPAEHFNLAAEYVMTTTHPALARQTAEKLSARFGSMARIAREKAAKLPEGHPDKAKLLEQADKYSEFTTDELLRRWPPGEKTIVFTKGRVSVGSGEGGTP